MEKLRWGIIGPGKIAVAFMADMPRTAQCANTIEAVMSNDMDEAAQFAKEYSIPLYFNSIKDMLDNSPVDIIYIASPHSAHCKESIECLKRNKPVLCEKPLALNRQQAKEMITTARNHHTFLMEGMWIRFLPSIQTVLELLSKNAIGKIKSLIADMSYIAPLDEENRFYNPDLGGGSLMDLGIYPVYLSLLVLGQPCSIKAKADLTAKHIDKNCTGILNYQDGVFALLESSITKDTDRQARIYGEKGNITILRQWNEKPEAVVASLHEGAVKRYPCEWEGRGFQFEIDEVARCLSAHRIESDMHSHLDSLKLIETLDKIREKTNIVYPVDAFT